MINNPCLNGCHGCECNRFNGIHIFLGWIYLMRLCAHFATTCALLAHADGITKATYAHKCARFNIGEIFARILGSRSDDRPGSSGCYSSLCGSDCSLRHLGSHVRNAACTAGLWAQFENVAILTQGALLATPISANIQFIATFRSLLSNNWLNKYQIIF